MNHKLLKLLETTYGRPVDDIDPATVAAFLHGWEAGHGCGWREGWTAARAVYRPDTADTYRRSVDA